MSTVSYLFGNVDKQGQLEKNQVDEDLTEILNQQDTSEYLNKILATTVLKEATDLSKSNEERVQPLENALDYQDIDELANDLTPLKPAPLQAQFFRPSQLPVSNYQDQSRTLPVPALLLEGRLKFSEIFKSYVEPTKKTFRNKSLAGKSDDGFELANDEVKVFQKPMVYRYSKDVEENVEVVNSDLDVLSSVAVKPDNVDSAMALSTVMLDPWEEKVLWNTDETTGEMPVSQSIQMFRNEHLQDDEWIQSVFWDENEPCKPIAFHMDDPTLIIMQDEVDMINSNKGDSIKSLMYKKRPDGKIIDKFNISDDWRYETVKTKLARVRQTHGPVKLQHSLPAIKLHTQYFKPLLHVKELRSFHRPSLKFNIGEVITFSKVKTLKKKKFKDIDPAEMMKTPKDLSLKDTAKYVLVEYSEEYPPMIQNVGMASLIYNYYRKKDEKDNFVPKMPNGGALILEAVDVSPFFGFGDVEPGQSMQVLYNNLFRVPIFHTHVQTSDYLCIRQTYQGVTKYYLREIPNMYVAGQCYPVQEVPRPQARKITQALKMRLQVVGYRLMRKDPHRRLQYDKLRKHFPMFTDAQIRQKLKEFAQYLKKGENTGWWKLKSHLVLPDEEGIRKIITPESICLQHSTLVGQQRLKDAGYGVEDLKETEDEETESHLDIEVQLAPWTTTKNFTIAASGKGMVQLFGQGDPTGCGEGFSFIRASMKEMFFHHGSSTESRNAFIDNKSKLTYHKYSIIEQQKVYRTEIDRIWKNQLLKLGSSDPSRDKNEEELQNLRSKTTILENEEERERQNNFGGETVSSPAPFSPPNIENNAEDHHSDADVDAQSVPGSTLAGKNKMLVINRYVRDATSGEMAWKSEIITDARVINAYLRHRKLIEAPAADSGDGLTIPEPCGKPRIKRRTYAHIVRLQIKQGKKPPLPDDEELSESELPKEFLKNTGVADNKAPSAGEKTGEKSTSKKKRSNSVVFAPTQKPTSKRRVSPEVSLAEIHGNIVNSLISIPDAGIFCRPVSQIQVVDYYNIVKKPMCLEQIRDKAKKFQYRTSQSFLDDVKLIVDNCKLYNGEAHPLSTTANGLLSKAITLLKEEEEKITELETELLKGDETAVGNGPQSSPTKQSEMDIDIL